MGDLMYIGGAVALLAGGLAIFQGLAAWSAHCFWVWQFKAGMARGIRRSVKLGWNTGIPDDGQWVLVREHMPHSGPCRDQLGDCDSGRWAVMQRRGDMLYSQTNGFAMPVRNLTGWLAVEMEHG